MWKKIKDWRELKEGDTVKLLVETMFGWKGTGTVIFAYPDGIHFKRDGDGTTVDCCLHEARVKRDAP